MSNMTLGKSIPEFTFTSTDSHLSSSSQLRGNNTVLFFYPKDNTPGCTLEAQSFRDLYKKFKDLDTLIIGISRDNLKSHDKFLCNHQLPYPLISDIDEKICTLFDVIKSKNMYGKMVRGIQRSTFLFDKAGILREEWRNVKVEGHAEEVLAAVNAMGN